MKRLAYWAMVAAACCAVLSGCFKDVSNATTYVLKPLISDGGTPVDTEHYITAYAYYVDTTAWAVRSYDDALAMRLTNKETGEVLTEPDVVGEPFTDEIMGGKYCLELFLRRNPVMLVAVDEELRVYGYRKQTLGENLPRVYESVTFYTSKNGRRYKAGQWVMCNDFYGQTVEPDQPDEPEIPVDPENPETPENPENPDSPDVPDGDDDNSASDDEQ
ncbi:MAG: hypothetical protein K2I43_05150 [Alistipes sp.]|nr:hypothetical protein [Alistipes sp.]